MRVLLDTKDLINGVEHSKPVSLADLESWLKTKGAPDSSFHLRTSER
jgi:hypothetical protein